jgi:hypothetical protein
MKGFAAVFFACLLAGTGNALAGPNGSVIIAEGFSAPNSYSGELPDIFVEWCGGVCFPTVTLAVTDAKKTRHLGYIHAWGKEPTGTGVTIQFKEFIIGEFSGGQIYTISQEGGHPGGAFADPSLIPPKQGVVVLVGGAEGQVVGGTGKYADASGAYSTRLKVEDDGNGTFIYYDELYFRYREVKLD